MDNVFAELCPNLCPAERDRLAAAEICIDELLTILKRHGIARRENVFLNLQEALGLLRDALTTADGLAARLERLVRIRRQLTAMIPLTDQDLQRAGTS